MEVEELCTCYDLFLRDSDHIAKKRDSEFKIIFSVSTIKINLYIACHDNGSFIPKFGFKARGCGICGINGLFFKDI
jgi:hypothetical protein